MFVAVGALLLAAAALLAVAYPILAGRQRTSAIAVASPEDSASQLNYGVAPGQAGTTPGETLQELLAQRDAAFQALRELSFDHQVGKVTDEDYAVFEANLKGVAADSLRNLDGWEAQADRELGPGLESVAARVAALKGGGRACPDCGRTMAEGDRFCAACGAPAPPEAPTSTAPQAPTVMVCPNCREPFEAGDRFCGKCGQALPGQAPLTPSGQAQTGAAQGPGAIPGK